MKNRDGIESKCSHETTLYTLVRDDFGAVEKLTTSAIERHQNRDEPMHIRSIHERFWILA